MASDAHRKVAVLWPSYIDGLQLARKYQVDLSNPLGVLALCYYLVQTAIEGKWVLPGT
jgi:hypothetical protein